VRERVVEPAHDPGLLVAQQLGLPDPEADVGVQPPLGPVGRDPLAEARPRPGERPPDEGVPRREHPGRPGDPEVPPVAPVRALDGGGDRPAVAPGHAPDLLAHAPPQDVPLDGVGRFPLAVAPGRGELRRALEPRDGPELVPEQVARDLLVVPRVAGRDEVEAVAIARPDDPRHRPVDLRERPSHERGVVDPTSVLAERPDRLPDASSWPGREMNRPSGRW
jgi:hypothetical protein